MRVKLFYEISCEILEETMNKWIEDNESIISIKSINVDFSDRRYYTGYIVYERINNEI